MIKIEKRLRKGLIFYVVGYILVITGFLLSRAGVLEKDSWLGNWWNFGITTFCILMIVIAAIFGRPKERRMK